jgi:hypothetical protein
VADTTVAYEGWNASGVAWGDQGWGQGVTILPGATGEVGTVTVAANADVDVTGFEATSAVGTVTVAANADVDAVGVEGTGAVGTVAITGDANVDATGLEATGEVGTVTVAANADVDVVGVGGTGEIGTVAVTAGADVDVTGLEATSAVGSVQVTGTNVVAVTGVQGAGQIGTVTPAANATVSVSGVSAVGQVGPLYDNSAAFTAATTAYTVSNEVGNSGSYAAGGGSLTNVDPTTSSTTAFTDFADLSFTSATITAFGALIYNSTPTHTYSDPTVCVLDFSGAKTSTNGTFTIIFPTDNSARRRLFESPS